MKKIKSLAALLIALAFFAPTALLVACDTDKEISAPNLSADTETSEDASPDSAPETDKENTENETPPTEEETPSAPSTPSTPSTPTTPEKPVTPEKDPESTPTPVVKNAQYIRCTGDRVNIRSGAGTSYTVLGSAEEGTSYAVLEKTGNWYKTYYRGKTAYIYASYAALFTLTKTEDSDVENVITEGYKTLGTPYVYGAVRVHDGKGKLLAGFSAQKFDCSSLIQYIFYKGAGVLLLSNTRTQVTQGKYVAKDKLQRGDCIYFTNEDRQYNTGIEKIGHVALYLGDNYILHTASDYARIEKMTASRWQYYVEARRFL
ncbi:MAG: C40 family peptidase [Clostridia bacterium]|nr:C40 family peptidase [Clostridia bacterium]